MAKVALNKSSLAAQSQQLKGYRQFLPSLDLKRKQLLGRRARIQGERRAIETELAALRARVAEALPMLANHEIDLTELVRIEQIELGRENLMGIWLPTIADLRIAVQPYGYLAKPHWVDPLAATLIQVARLRVRLHLTERRLALLDQAVRTVTQRVNLFDKVLIPRTQANIKRIRVALADAERAAVVRAKIAKKKRAAEGLV